MKIKKEVSTKFDSPNNTPFGGVCMGFKKYFASQSRSPKGFIGKLMGKLMNNINAPMNEKTIQLLDIEEQDHILEIGFGNGKYIADIIKRIKGTHVCGIDYSDTMVQAATKLNKAFIKQGRVQIKQGDIEKIPFDDSMFNKIFSVNTIYFWSRPILALRDIRRVLKPGGRLVISFRSREIMTERASDDYDFKLYTPAAEEIENLLTKTGYSSIRIEHFIDKSIDYYCVIAEKQGTD